MASLNPPHDVQVHAAGDARHLGVAMQLPNHPALYVWTQKVEAPVDEVSVEALIEGGTAAPGGPWASRAVAGKFEINLEVFTHVEHEKW